MDCGWCGAEYVQTPYYETLDPPDDRESNCIWVCDKCVSDVLNEPGLDEDDDR